MHNNIQKAWFISDYYDNRCVIKDQFNKNNTGIEFNSIPGLQLLILCPLSYFTSFHIESIRFEKYLKYVIFITKTYFQGKMNCFKPH